MPMVHEVQAPFLTREETASLFGDTEIGVSGRVSRSPSVVRMSTRSTLNKASRTARTGTFIDNLKLPVHRWYRYSAGFSAKWVESVLEKQQAHSLFDPFAGSGTSLLAADALGIPSLGTESHPFVHRLAAAKLSWNFEPRELNSAARELARVARSLSSVPAREADSLIARIYAPATLDGLERLRLAHGKIALENCSSEIGDLLWLAITSILRSCSFAGTAQWQYVLPNKPKTGGREREPFAAFNAAIQQMLEDRSLVQLEGWRRQSVVAAHDAREPFALVGHRRFDSVITSPPYPNNYDYADATRLEMTFWKEITGWADLQHSVRRHLMRSCSQHAAAERLDLDALLGDTVLDPIRPELAAVCKRLAEVRLTKGGKKVYHTMIAAYFTDLGHIFYNLRAITRPGATVCFVIGDSAPYGVHVPAERWLGVLAVAAGFTGWRFEKLRDRNIKWDNRVHDVPLQEGNLWIEA